VRALAALHGFTLLAGSRIYHTEAMGDPGGPPFLNCAVAGLWAGAPEELLSACFAIEASGGRRRSYPNAPRTLDIDILFWEGRQISTPRLTVPHPRLFGRAFALLPLLALAPDAFHPGTGRPLSEHVTGALLAQGIRLQPSEAGCA